MNPSINCPLCHHPPPCNHHKKAIKAPQFGFYIPGSPSERHQVGELLLNNFWKRFGSDGCKNWRSRHGRLKTLQGLSEICEQAKLLLGRVDRDKIFWKRVKFDRVKGKRHSMQSHRICFACGQEAQVRHHIIPLKNGGHNDKRNIVSLCNPCHEIIHPWLAVHSTTNPDTSGQGMNASVIKKIRGNADLRPGAESEERLRQFAVVSADNPAPPVGAEVRLPE